MAAPDKIKKLVDDFERLKRGRVPDSFDEAQLRVSYVNPFWEALGWNVRDYREVVIEKVVPMRHSTKRADYCFLLNGRPAFVLETKDFRKHLDDADVVFQLNRYGYSLRVDFGFLTNFAELQLYETWKRPLIENPVKNRVNKFHFDYQEYVERWDELAAALGRDAVAAGALNEFLTKKEPTRNKEAVDRKFFEGLNEWRAELARVIALRNIDLSVHDINEAVQRILDRCIFMRVIEDRGIEATELLLDALTRWGREKEKPLYRYVVDKFRYLEPQYNGELFEKHFSEELLVDDKPLRDFIESLYYPKSPYQFNVVGVEMLGTIYERFLGSTIRLTPSHRAVVEEKPEVRKAGGVYYTPKYIVDYIVENTVGELLKKCKTPAAAAKLKILDPACGSGSFLLGAFQRLIDWHEDYFTANPDKIGKGLAAACWHDADEGKYRLTARYKGQILVNNIFGVDIDTQACEVTRMSLYLKILESVNVQFLMKTALLPQLDNNIKCGNSLIGSDYFDVDQAFLPVGRRTGTSGPQDEEERRRVNPFDWDVEFEDIMKAGGFDAVIGNPPYGASLKDSTKVYLSNKYDVVSDFESSQYFIVKANKLLNKGGLLSLIIPNTMILNVLASGFRRYLVEEFGILSITNLADVDVFEGATVRTIILVLSKAVRRGGSVEFKKFTNRDSLELVTKADQSFLLNEASVWYELFTGLTERALWGKIKAVSVELDTILAVSQGLIPYDKYRGHDENTIKNRIWHSDHKKDETYKRELRGGDVRRYSVKWNGKQWISYGEWLGAPRKPYYFTKPRLLFREITDPKTGLLHVAYTSEEYYNNPGIINCISRGTEYSLLYILGIVNSSLLATYHYHTSPKAQKGVFPKILVNDVRHLPIHRIDFSDPADVARHDKMVALVEEMLELHKRLAAAKSDADKKRLQRAIAATDRKIDNLVYGLYGLKDEEIKFVEGEAD